ncbi:agenet domain-containing protein / bromo-adjacenthomology (BAH) domain-containing protein [Striga asiatica]|uniref:Agenet domain-containing protein / bromo-adjacenthomology (BAH) domain-containing protein n=1 Tax=Striga asiatica TaxID=4170 RepID=A0A5A7RLT3_STRAF|nr:agenet domain-containing protein / bromo-adjacenthomology (BAH) domain-containing protein [Striga asiatica]
MEPVSCLPLLPCSFFQSMADEEVLLVDCRAEISRSLRAAARKKHALVQSDDCSLEVSMCNSPDIGLALPVEKNVQPPFGRVGCDLSQSRVFRTCSAHHCLSSIGFLQPLVGGALRLSEDKQSVAAVRGVTRGVVGDGGRGRGCLSSRRMRAVTVWLFPSKKTSSHRSVGSDVISANRRCSEPARPTIVCPRSVSCSRQLVEPFVCRKTSSRLPLSEGSPEVSSEMVAWVGDVSAREG